MTKMDDDITTIGGCLIAVRGQRSQIAFAKELGVHKNTLGSYERGERTPDVGFLHRLAEQGFDMNWLVTGEGTRWKSGGPAFISTDLQGVQEPAASYGDNWVWISALDNSPIGETHNTQSVASIALRSHWMTKQKLTRQGLVMVELEGDAMQPEIQAGSLLLVDTAQRLLNSDCLYVMRSQGYTFAKRVQRLTDGSIRLSCDNPAYEDEMVSAAEVPQLEVVGRVVWVGQAI